MKRSRLSLVLYFLKGDKMKESKFQAGIKKEIKNKLHGAIIMKTDPRQIQGIPDLLILYKDKWAMLECKDDPKANKRPNQSHYISKIDSMSFARFINPENKKEVLNDLQRAFKS